MSPVHLGMVAARFVASGTPSGKGALVEDERLPWGHRRNPGPFCPTWGRNVEKSKRTCSSGGRAYIPRHGGTALHDPNLSLPDPGRRCTPPRPPGVRAGGSRGGHRPRARRTRHHPERTDARGGIDGDPGGRGPRRGRQRHGPHRGLLLAPPPLGRREPRRDRGSLPARRAHADRHGPEGPRGHRPAGRTRGDGGDPGDDPQPAGGHRRGGQPAGTPLLGHRARAAFDGHRHLGRGPQRRGSELEQRRSVGGERGRSRDACPDRSGTDDHHRLRRGGVQRHRDRGARR